ncbi:olfactory receptor 14A16-like [Tachyglossus aculeatus]|uniref:olfactory receptor 14A16-like n=1 Tax=Tachyglossus aculeatus TaxID=9261 RepID=UPI0018F2FA7F|nr:olfactory receptor 14A16-like [Tachyglossus aculeatus]
MALREFLLLGFSEVRERQLVHAALLLLAYLVALMAAASWFGGGLNGVIHTAMAFSLPFCATHAIRQFFCDTPSLLHISCSRCFIYELAILGFSMFLGLCRFVGIIVSLSSDHMANHTFVMEFLFLGFSEAGSCEMSFLTTMCYDRYEAICHPLRYSLIMDRGFFCDAPSLLKFSCSETHVVVDVTVAMGNGFGFVSFESSPMPSTFSDSPQALDLQVSVFHTVLPPAVNPLFYSLRNRGIKAALRKICA